MLQKPIETFYISLFGPLDHNPNPHQNPNNISISQSHIKLKFSGSDSCMWMFQYKSHLNPNPNPFTQPHPNPNYIFTFTYLLNRPKKIIVTCIFLFGNSIRIQDLFQNNDKFTGPNFSEGLRDCTVP